MATSVDESRSGAIPSNGGDFECNICFELAQDPIVTLCGHLFCWPCLYKWLRHHSQSQECPVCKALVREEELVPLYGRGKTATDPRSRPVPGFEIPSRPPAQRPETAPSPAEPGFGWGVPGGFVPIAATTIHVNGFGGQFPPLFSFPIYHGFPDAALYGYAQQTPSASQGRGSLLKGLLLLIGFFLILTLCWN